MPKSNRGKARAIGAALLALAVLVAAGAAAVGEIDAAPIWLVSGVAALAAVVAQLVPEALSAARKRQQQDEEAQQAAAQLDTHLDAVQQRFRDHMATSNPFEAQEDSAGFIDRLVRERGQEKGRGDVTSLAELLMSLTDPSSGKNRLLLIGEGGVGKTTSLLQLASDAAARARSDPLAPVPVYVELSRFDASERGFDRLQEMAANAMLGVDRAGFDHRWREGARPLLLLLDGLNEQRGTAAACVAGIRDLAARRPHLCVVTSRSTVEADEFITTDDGLRTAELLRLEPAEVERFFVDHGLGRLYEEMSDALKGLARNPFMLIALVRTTAGRPEAALPRNVGELYRSFVDEYVYTRREPGRGHVRYAYEAIKKPLLAALAARMTAEGTTVEPSGPASDTFLRERLAAAWGDGEGRESMPDRWGPKDFRAEVVANGILRPAEGGVEFMHQSVQEYFTAVALESEPVEAVVEKTRPLIWRHIDLQRHEDAGSEDPYRVPVTMLSGLRSRSDDLVTALARRHPVLAAECVGAATSVDPGIAARLRDEWVTLLGRAHERYRSVAAQCLTAARISGGDAIPRLIDVAIEDPEFAVRRSARAALDQLGIAGAEDYLAEKVQRPSRYDDATELLVARAPRRAVRVLLEHWAATPTSDRREQAEAALRLVDRETAVDELAALRSQDDGPIGDAAETLLRRLESSSDEPRTRIPRASELRQRMRELKEEADARVAGKPAGELLELLSSPNAYTRGAAATALAALGQTDALPRVIEALSKESSSNLNVAEMARAARRLGGEEATASLLERAHGPDTAALLTLPGPWPPDLAPGAVPEAVSEALEAAGVGRPEDAFGGQGRWELKVRGSRADVVLEERDGRLTALRTGVRERMLRAAALITPNERLAPALVVLLGHEDPAVRATALELLREGANVDVTAPIADLLERETAEPVVSAASVALARAGTPRARTILVELVARGRLAGDRIEEAFDRLEHPEHVDEQLCERAARERDEAQAGLLRALSLVRRRQATLASGDATAHDRSRAMLVEAALTEADDEARRAAAAALRWSAGDPGTVELTEGLGSTEPARRARAARALGDLQDDRAAPALAEALEREDDGPTRLEIATSLLELRADETLDTAKSALAELIISDEDCKVRRSARARLGRATTVSDDPLYDLMADLYDTGRDDELERTVGRCLECLDTIGFNDAVYLWLRGSSRARRGRYEEALTDYDTAVEHSGIAAVHGDRASVLATLGRHADALDAQRLAVEGDPDDAGSQALLSQYAYEAGDLDLSTASRLKALELARSLPHEKRRAVLDDVRRDLEALRARRPELAATVDAQLRAVREASGGS
jgi:HEAT repeat protein